MATQSAKDVPGSGSQSAILPLAALASLTAPVTAGAWEALGSLTVSPPGNAGVCYGGGSTTVAHTPSHVSLNPYKQILLIMYPLVTRQNSSNSSNQSKLLCS